MLPALIGALAGACIGFVRWNDRAVQVQGRFFPHQGSGLSLVLGMMIHGAIVALVFLGADAMTRDSGQVAEELVGGQDVPPSASDGTVTARHAQSPRVIEGIPFVVSSQP